MDEARIIKKLAPRRDALPPKPVLHWRLGSARRLAPATTAQPTPTTAGGGPVSYKVAAVTAAPVEATLQQRKRIEVGPLNPPLRKLYAPPVKQITTSAEARGRPYSEREFAVRGPEIYEAMKQRHKWQRGPWAK